jgi:hypothetical protein
MPHKDATDVLDAGGSVNDLVPFDETRSDTPSASEPLRGREALAKVAVLGGDRIRALAALRPAYVWQDIAVVGIVVVLAGGPGEGKTTLLFLILVARMTLGAPVTLLGRRVEPIGPGRYVVLIEGEHGESSAARKLVSSCEILAVDTACLDRIILVARKAVRLGSPEWLDVVELVRAGLVSDIAIDTVARVAPADADNEREQVEVFDRIAQAIEVAPSEDAKPVAWVIAHTRKNGAGDSLADVSGSTQRTGQADTVLLVKGERVDGRVVSSTVTFAKLREEPDDYPAPTAFAIVTGSDGRRTLATVEAPAADDRPLEERILDRLKLGPRAKSKLATELSRSRGDIDEALQNLFSSRAIETTTLRIRGRDFKAFTLRQQGRWAARNETGRTPDEGCPADDNGRERTDS